MGLGGLNLSPPKQKYSPPNKMKPISPFGLGLIFFARYVSKIQLIGYRYFSSGKRPTKFALKNVG